MNPLCPSSASSFCGENEIYCRSSSPKKNIEDDYCGDQEPWAPTKSFQQMKTLESQFLELNDKCDYMEPGPPSLSLNLMKNLES